MARAFLSASRSALALVGVGAGELVVLGEQEGENIVVVKLHKHKQRIVIVEALLMLEDCTVEVVGLSSRRAHVPKSLSLSPPFLPCLVAKKAASHPSTSPNAAEAHAAIIMTFAKARGFA